MASVVTLRSRSSADTLRRHASSKSRSPPGSRKQNKAEKLQTNGLPTSNLPTTTSANGGRTLKTSGGIGYGTHTTPGTDEPSEEAEPPDPHAPSGKQQNARAIKSPTSSSMIADIKTARSEIVTWAGHVCDAEHDGDKPKVQQDSQSDIDMHDGSSLGVAEDLSNYDLDGDFSDAGSPNASDLEKDDDYGDVDGLTDPSSQGSNADEVRFEQQVEQDLQDLDAQGGIDWDNAWSLQYDPAAGHSDYDICGEDGMLRSTNDMAQRQSSFTIELEPNLPMLSEFNHSFAFPQNSRSVRSGSWSSFTSSTGSTPVTPSLSPRPSAEITPRTSSLTSTILTEDNSDDETEDDEEYRTSHRPAVPSSTRCDSKPKFRYLDDPTLPKPAAGQKALPVLRKIKPSKAPSFVFPVRRSGAGRAVRFVLPRNRHESMSSLSSDSLTENDNSWDTTSGSGRDSPTFIDWEDAITSGNINSGASITDTIRGRIFARTHCRPREEDQDALEPISSFYARLTNVSASSMHSGGLFDVFDDPNSEAVVFDDLIDVEECGEPSSHDQTPLGPPLLESPTFMGTSNAHLSEPMFEQVLDPVVNEPVGGALSEAVSVATLGHQDEDAVMTPITDAPCPSRPQTPAHQTECLAPPYSPLSPSKKRRLSEHSNSASGSALQKKGRFTGGIASSHIREASNNDSVSSPCTNPASYAPMDFVST